MFSNFIQKILTLLKLLLSFSLLIAFTQDDVEKSFKYYLKVSKSLTIEQKIKLLDRILSKYKDKGLDLSKIQKERDTLNRLNKGKDKDKKIYIWGAVKEPQEIEYSKDLTLLKAISMVGGFTQDADLSSIFIFRTTDKNFLFKVNVQKIYEGKEKDIILNLNDRIYVSRKK